MRVLEVGAGLGSLTVALAESGASVLAVEFDRVLLPALEEVVGDRPDVRIVHGDAMKMDWRTLFGRGGERTRRRWRMVSNLPYNIATPLVLSMLEERLPIDVYFVTVQKEVGERLAADPGTDAYGAVSVRVSYFAEPKVLRRVPASVFWPRPNVESVLVRLTPRPKPPVDVDPDVLFRLVEEGFAQRRKTMANALRRLGFEPQDAAGILRGCGLDPRVRAEELSLADFARLTEEVGARA